MKKDVFKRMLNLRSFTLVGIVALTVFLVSCNEDSFGPSEAVQVADSELKSGKSIPPSDMSIAKIAMTAGFDSLVVALAYVDANISPSPGLVNLFANGTDQYTVFAPTNVAFAALVGGGSISDLPADLVFNVLLYHVTDGRRASNSVVPKKNPKMIETLLGETFKVDSSGKIWAVGNTANIIAADISASNGIIHVIDNVILPIE